MSDKFTDLDRLQAYIKEHWNEKYENVRYSKALWRLVDACKADFQLATNFVEHHLLKGALQDRVTASILAGQICNPLEPEIKKYTDRVSKVIIASANTETHNSVLMNTADSLRFMELSPELIEVAIRLTYKDDENVRFYAARSLSSLVDDVYASDEVIDRLIELSADKDADIRDWCTYGLGNLVEIWGIDQPKIRDAFLARVKDRHNDTRAEAFHGLAVSHDERGIQPLKSYLKTSQSIGRLDIAAAKEYAKPDFYQVLLEIQQWWNVDSELISEAVMACAPKK